MLSSLFRRGQSHLVQRIDVSRRLFLDSFDIVSYVYCRFSVLRRDGVEGQSEI